MKLLMTAVVLTMLSAPAWAKKDCEALKTEIEARIQSHGVKSFELAIVAKAQAGENKVVGSCEGGSKEITYKRL